MSKEKSDAVMEFVGNIAGAFDAGFIDTPILTIGQLYQVARNHVKDNYGIDEPQLSEVFSEEFAELVNPKIETPD